MLQINLLVAFAGLAAAANSHGTSVSGAVLRKIPANFGFNALTFNLAVDCEVGTKECEGTCIPLSGSCCNNGDSGYCPQGSYCYTAGGCCDNGDICSGHPSGCGDGLVSCGDKFMPEDAECCGDSGSHCPADRPSCSCSGGGSGGGSSGGSSDDDDSSASETDEPTERPTLTRPSFTAPTLPSISIPTIASFSIPSLEPLPLPTDLRSGGDDDDKSNSNGNGGGNGGSGAALNTPSLLAALVALLPFAL